ncbi:unnamed protein product [Ectocarpus fasciculatus]
MRRRSRKRVRREHHTRCVIMMKTSSNRWLGLLGAAVIMWSSATSVAAYTQPPITTSDQFAACEAAEDIGNGRCNVDNNIEECGFDGGDCCECTCEDGEFTCGQYYGYACIDPGADCVDDDAVTVDMMENCYDPGRIGNGVCDNLQNNEQCDYDGGDCCECTCDPSGYPWYDTGVGCRTGMYSGGFSCIDPDAPCVDDDIITAEMLDLCAASQIGNGYCDDTNNNPECAYDGGDCCECTCVPHDDGYEYYCQEGSFACIDPSAECVNDDDNTAEQYEHCGSVTRIGDGMCDDSNNKEECGKYWFPNFDGGDCCSCTCVVQPWAWSEYACEEVYNINSFDCLDTSASCYGGSPSYDLSFDWDYSM